MQFPEYRPRRMRRSEAIRSLVRETVLAPTDFIMPYFVTPGTAKREPIGSMPGNFRLSADELVKDAKELVTAGVPGVILFGIPAKKDPKGSEAYNPDGVVQTAARRLKDALPDLLVVADVCIDEYTTHGHCGIVEDGDVDNDATVELLVRMAITLADAGADVVAPSDMMDGRVGAIREGLDAAGWSQVAIMSYAAKYASAYYGPFREAADSAPKFGDRRSYQMDPANLREALREIDQDIGEGADIVMVKPALAYLDVIAAARDHCDHPIAAYNVSGEFSMIKAASERGWIDGERAMMETLLAIKRAGADMILTYFALEAARVLGR